MAYSQYKNGPKEKTTACRSLNKAFCLILNRGVAKMSAFRVQIRCSSQGRQED